jgi:hypothetical protein
MSKDFVLGKIELKLLTIIVITEKGTTVEQISVNIYIVDFELLLPEFYCSPLSLKMEIIPGYKINRISINFISST